MIRMKILELFLCLFQGIVLFFNDSFFFFSQASSVCSKCKDLSSLCGKFFWNCVLKTVVNSSFTAQDLFTPHKTRKPQICWSRYT